MGHIYTLNKGLGSIEKSIKKSYHNINVKRDPYLKMFAGLVQELESGEKVVTIRYLKDSIRIPDVNDEYIIQLMQTTPENPQSGPMVGSIQIPKIYVGVVSEFPEKYFKLDGYPDKKTGLEDICDIYNCKLKPTDMLSMYWLENFERR